MPNHCHNDLWIDGPKNDIDALLALIGADQEEPKFDFNAIVPYPARFAEMDAAMAEICKLGNGGGHWVDRENADAKAAMAAYAAKYGTDRDGFNSGGYEWCTDNWETKWGAYNVSRRDYEGVCVTFQTAWAPPKKIIAALAARFPKLELSLEYFERGMAFCGGLSFVSVDDVDEGDDRRREWSGEYHGTRGG